MQIRTVKESEHALVRELRIAALNDAPESFAESAQAASARPEDYWIDLARSLTDEHVMFIAELDGKACGFVFGLRDVDNPNNGRVGGMWVASAYRGRGLGTALLAAVVQWGKTEEFSTVRLWVPASGVRAQSLYSKTGFVFNGQTKSVLGDTPFVVSEMELELSVSERVPNTTLEATR